MRRDVAERLGLYTVPSIGAESWHEVANEVRFGNSSASAGAWASNVNGEAGDGLDADAAAAGRPEYTASYVASSAGSIVRAAGRNPILSTQDPVRILKVLLSNTNIKCDRRRKAGSHC